MALVVEDGTGLATAESYVSVADTTTRLGALGISIWTDLTNAEMEEALRRATNYMGQAYRQRWQGARRTTTQALDWPRVDVVVDRYTAVAYDSIPADIANACADLALKAAAGDLNADLERAIIRDKTGPLETEYSPHSPQSVRYRSIDMALAPYLTGGGAMARLVRA